MVHHHQNTAAVAAVAVAAVAVASGGGVLRRDRSSPRLLPSLPPHHRSGRLHGSYEVSAIDDRQGKLLVPVDRVLVGHVNYQVF